MLPGTAKCVKLTARRINLILTAMCVKIATEDVIQVRICASSGSRHFRLSTGTSECCNALLNVAMHYFQGLSPIVFLLLMLKHLFCLQPVWLELFCGCSVTGRYDHQSTSGSCH